jgi:hypothetical protein
MQEPSASQRRPFFGCLAGTLKPSRRQMRSTRLSLMIQPAVERRSSAIFRLTVIASNHLPANG